MADKPHIVIFNPDSYRGDVLGHRGNPGAVTPSLDALVAKDAVCFTEAFAQNPVCTPSRCSFMTGWYPHTHGHRSMKNMLKGHEPNLLKVLRREGYHVWWGGKNDLVAVEKPEDYLHHCDVKFKTNRSYTGWKAPEPLTAEDPRRGIMYGGVRQPDPQSSGGDHDRACVDGAIDLIRGHDHNGPPLCLYLPLHDPHPTYRIEQHYYDLIDPAKLPPRLPSPQEQDRHPPILDALRREYESQQVDEDAWRDLRRIYYAMCAKIDNLFGQLVQALRDAGIYDNTLIVFLSDHGDFAGDYSLPEKTHSTLQDGLVRVPLVIKPPADHAVKAGCCDELVELVDMTTTIYDMLGIDPGYTTQGRSLRGLLAGQHQPIRDAVFAEVGSRADEEAFKNNDVLKLAPDSFYARQSRAALPYATEGSYAVMCRTHDWKYIRRGYNDWHELYDLRHDPGEMHNLSGQADTAAIQEQLQTRLLDYFMQTGDVLPRQQDSRAV